MDIVKPNTIWRVKKAIYGLREAPRLWQQERDRQLRELQFVYNDRSAHLVQSYIHPSLWFIVEGPRGQPTLKRRMDSQATQAQDSRLCGCLCRRPFDSRSQIIE